MKLRPKVIAIMILATTLIFVETRRTSAQDAPPDLRMLMNLDLFASPQSDTKGAPQPDESMLDQIRALSAMGYLGGNPESAGYARTGNAAAPASSPSESIEVQQNYQTFRNLPPEERKRVMEGLRKWRNLPTARRDELQHAYARYRRLRPDQRDKVMRRYRQFENLPPEQRERMLANYRRWQQMTPQQRMEAHRRFGMGRPRPHPGQRVFPREPAP